MEAKTTGADFYFLRGTFILYIYMCFRYMWSPRAIQPKVRVFIYTQILSRHWRARRPGVKPHSVELSACKTKFFFLKLLDGFCGGADIFDRDKSSSDPKIVSFSNVNNIIIIYRSDQTTDV